MLPDLLIYDLVSYDQVMCLISEFGTLYMYSNVSVVRFPADGDAVMALTLDKPYSNMVTVGNFNDKMKGGIWVELIYQKPMNLTTVEPFKIGSCKGYNGPVFNLPKVGDHLTVTGTYIIDVREGGHAEIHPTSSLVRK
jgi:hypothetical protein